MIIEFRLKRYITIISALSLISQAVKSPIFIFIISVCPYLEMKCLVRINCSHIDVKLMSFTYNKIFADLSSSLSKNEAKRACMKNTHIVLCFEIQNEEL